MPQRTILSVGRKLPGDFEFVSLNSKRSLADADIVVFYPSTLSNFEADDDHNGADCFSEEEAPRVNAATEHWSSEIADALKRGTPVITILCDKEEYYLDTGKRQHSGTGRNRQTTNIVRPSNNYEVFAGFFSITAHHGTQIVKTKHSGVISTYWGLLGSKSSYKVSIKQNTKTIEKIGKINWLPLLTTRKGDHIVGAIIQMPQVAPLILLPEFQLDQTLPTDILGRQLFSSIIEIDKSLRSADAEVPIPDWANAPAFQLPAEAQLASRISEITKQIEALSKQREGARAELKKVGQLKTLLYGTGKQLEKAVLDALRIIGFSAEPLVNAESEFDAVFSAPEGRFLGEVEGKDNSAINVDKLRQLEMNRREDLARDDVDELATGVLFGNAFRLTPPSSRNDSFTAKCASAARSSGVALVRTPDLFVVAKSLLETPDDAFAALCRKSLIEQAGSIVAFPIKAQSTPDEPGVQPTSETG
ncbi:hypothetical protein JYJ95_15315 [Corallococcus exiguus]|uniref:hypothetical protein n=1 Tax=Corallococcus exiguus TaxID=83462 RepID=UPI001A8E0D08|nr:hypothetical protein [Corallococcus exiguus]MBN8467889.1 hypothetical protein [Corallococcus exiguus]